SPADNQPMRGAPSSSGHYVRESEGAHNGSVNVSQSLSHARCGNDFKTLLSLKPTETVFFSFIVYKNKPHRNAVNKRVMAEMTKQSKPQVMPFDVHRMTHGGFKTVVQG